MIYKANVELFLDKIIARNLTNQYYMIKSEQNRIKGNFSAQKEAL